MQPLKQNPILHTQDVEARPDPGWHIHAEARLEPRPRFRPLQDRVVLFRGDRFTVVTFGLSAALGVVLATWLSAGRLLQVAEGQAAAATRALLVVGLLGVVGTRLLALALDWRTLLSDPGRALRKTGFAFQGALLVVVPSMHLYLRSLGIDPWLMLDVLALALPAGHAVGRLGCFSYGCCHGRPTTSRWAVRFSSPESRAVWDGRLQGIPVHPAQLYEAAALLGIFAVVNLFASAPRPAGTVTGLYIALYGLARFGLEHFRGEPGRRYFGFTAYQGISLGLFGAGLAVMGLCSGQPGLDWGRPGLGMDLVGALSAHWGVLLANFALFFTAYGVQGRKVGRW